MDVKFLIPREQWPMDIDVAAPSYSWSPNRFGKWNWTLQTLQHLQDQGYACEITHELEAPGIVIGHRDVIPTFYRPHSKQLLVCIAAERGLHPYAGFQILQNPVQLREVESKFLRRWESRLVGSGACFVRYWPQPGLIRRDPELAGRLERICFMGVPDSLGDEFRSPKFAAAVEELGMHWDPVHDKGKWPDYSAVDCIVAVRRSGDPVNDRKPATKLYNAWIAGVPAILGPESAYRHEGNPGRDYLEAANGSEVLECLKRLREEPGLREGLVMAGQERAEQLTPKALTEQWIEMIEERLKPLYAKWAGMPTWQRWLFFAARQTRLQAGYGIRRLQEILGGRAPK